MAQLVIPSQPIVLSVPTGSSKLPLVEVDKTKVQTAGQHIRTFRIDLQQSQTSFGKFQTSLDFTAWKLFHAAKKTELASSFTSQQADRRAFAFALEHESTFVWNTQNLRKVDSGVFELEDCASSGLAGRVGEAIAYLTMVKLGYAFWDRCSTVWARAARHANITHPEQLQVAQYLSSQVACGRPQNEPDFVFEKRNRDVALMEAKGSFVDPIKDNPSTKDDLRQALTQLAAWSGVIAPSPQKCYAIGTYLREEQDSNGDPSLIAYVDPEGAQRPGVPRAELSPDLVRRCNYGAWLTGMGLVSAGRALRDMREKAVEEVLLPVVDVGGRPFAVMIAGWKTPLGQGLPFIEPRWWPLGPHRSSFLNGSTFVIGIERSILRVIEKAIRQPTSPVLRETDGQALADLPELGGESSGSIMRDGSYVGTLNRDDIHAGFGRMETFRL